MKIDISNDSIYQLLNDITSHDDVSKDVAIFLEYFLNTNREGMTIGEVNFILHKLVAYITQTNKLAINIEALRQKILEGLHDDEDKVP